MRKCPVFYVLIGLFILVSFGCQKRAITQPEVPQTGQQTDMTQSSKVPEKISEQRVGSKVDSIESKDISSKSAEEKEGMFADVYFDFDKYDLNDTYKPIVKSVSSWMLKNINSRLSIEGHCDERGTNEYNLALGDRRARSVKDYLVSLGIPSSRIDTISYGEEKPVCREHSEECWAKNRRAHFVVLNKAGKK
jgi:peptidoglycan-associated lipoprotein